MKIRDIALVLGLAAFATACSPAADEAATEASEEGAAADTQDSEDEEQCKSRGPGR